METESLLKRLALPIVLFLVALGFRLWGIHWALPYVVHPDEPVIVDNVVSMVKRGSLDPNFFQYPSLFFYWQYAVTQLWLLWQQISGSGITAATIPDSSHIYTLTPSLYTWGRSANALLGSGGVVVIYLLVKRIFGLAAGVIAALMLAVSPFHVENSHYITVDVMMWTFACLALLFAYEVATKGPGQRWLAFAAGLSVGFTTGVKYTGLAMLGAVGIAWLLSLRVESGKWKVKSEKLNVESGAGATSAQTQPSISIASKASLRFPLSTFHFSADALIRLALIVVGAALGFLITTPFFVFDAARFAQSFGRESGAYGTVGSVGEYFGNLGFYIASLWPSEWFIILPGIIGVGYLFWRDWRKGLLLGLLPFLYLLAVSYLGVTYSRNAYLSVALLVPPAAAFIAALPSWLISVGRAVWVRVRRTGAQNPRQGWYALAILLLLTALLYLPIRESAAYDAYNSQRDTALQAQDWMQQQRALGMRFAVELHPWQFLDWPDVIAHYPQGDAQPPLTAQPPTFYANLGYNYAVLNSSYDKTRSLSASDYLTAYQALPLVINFLGDKHGGQGPDLNVYQLGSGFSALNIEQRTSVRLGTLAVLRGYDYGPVANQSAMFSYTPASKAPLLRGGLLGLNLYFQATNPDGQDWTLFLHLLDANGNIISQIDVPTRYGATIPHPTGKWHAGEYIIGGYSLPIPATAPPGSYRLELGLYQPASSVRLSPQGDGVTVSDNALVIDSIEIK